MRWTVPDPARTRTWRRACAGAPSFPFDPATRGPGARGGCPSPGRLMAGTTCSSRGIGAPGTRGRSTSGPASTSGVGRSRRWHGEDGPRRPRNGAAAVPPPTPRQYLLADRLLQRYRLTATVQELRDRSWVERLISVFALAGNGDLEIEGRIGGNYAVRLLLERHREGDEPEEIDEKIRCRPGGTRLALDLLRRSGCDLERPVEIHDDVEVDPEEEYQDEMERRLEDPAARPPRRPRNDVVALLDRLRRSAEPPPVLYRPPRLDPRTSRVVDHLAAEPLEVRNRWRDRALALGLSIPRAACARENLHLWIGPLLEEIAATEGIRFAPNRESPT